LLLLLGELQHPADHQRSGDVAAGGVHRLHLEADLDQLRRDVAAGDPLGQWRVLPQPGQRCPHRAPPTSDRLNRTSPSIMSRVASAPVRPNRDRSTAIPHAKPEPTEESTPPASTTRGFATPHPPHSIQPSLRLVRHGLYGSPTE